MASDINDGFDIRFLTLVVDLPSVRPVMIVVANIALHTSRANRRKDQVDTSFMEEAKYSRMRSCNLDSPVDNFSISLHFVMSSSFMLL